MKRFAFGKINLFFFALTALGLLSTERLWAMGGTAPSGYPSSFMMGLVDDDYQDALNSYGLGVNAEVNTVSQYMVPTGASYWDAVYRYLEGGLACTGSGWYAQYPGSGGAIGNFANLANGSGFQPIFIYYQIGGVYVSSMTNATFMGEYFQDWEQFLIQINTWMTAHSGKVVTVDIEPDMFGTIQQGGGSPTSYAVDVASATKPSCTTPWVSLSAYPNTLAGYCQAMLYLKDLEMSAGNDANLKIAFHVSGWAVSPNPATTSGMTAGSLSTHASSIATFLNACQPSSGSKFDLFFTDPSGYDGGYQSTYNWDTGGAMATQYAAWLNDLTADVSLRCMLWQVPEGNSKMNNVLGHYKDVRPEYFLNDSPLNSSGYMHNICQYVASGCVGVLWGPGDYHDTDVMDFFYPANYAGSTSQQDGSANSGAGSWGSAVVDDDGGFFRTHIANNHTWGATCPLNASASTSTSTPTNSPTTAPNTPTRTATYTSTNTATVVVNTATRTATSTSTNTATNTATKTSTATPSNTTTPMATSTQTLTNSSTPTLTSTMTSTPGANTSTSTDTSTVSATYTMSNTAAANTSTATSTNTLVANTSTTTATRTQTNTATGVLNTSTATNTQTSSNTAALPNTSTSTATVTYTVTNSATNTSTVPNTATVTNTATGVLNTATVTSTQTATATSTITSTQTATVSNTATSTMTPTSTATNTITPKYTGTNTNTSTFTPTVTNTNTVTLSPTVTNTPTITATPTATTVTHVICSPPYPNPVTTGPLKVDVMTPPGPCVIHMEIFTTAFRKVSEHNWHAAAVTTTVLWDLRDRMGMSVADGLYYVRIRVTGASSSSTILKVLVLK